MQFIVYTQFEWSLTSHWCLV